MILTKAQAGRKGAAARWGNPMPSPIPLSQFHIPERFVVREVKEGTYFLIYDTEEDRVLTCGELFNTMSKCDWTTRGRRTAEHIARQRNLTHKRLITQGPTSNA